MGGYALSLISELPAEAESRFIDTGSESDAKASAFASITTPISE